MQVTKITPRLVSTDILCVGNKPLSDERFSGIIRSQIRYVTHAPNITGYDNCFCSTEHSGIVHLSLSHMLYA